MAIKIYQRMFKNLTSVCAMILALSNICTQDEIESELHKNLDLRTLTIITPPPCDPNIDFLYIVHTAPSHFELRNTLRSSWASSRNTNTQMRRVFLIGRSNETIEKLILEEHNAFDDIFMYDKVDAYRNMTIKVMPIFGSLINEKIWDLNIVFQMSKLNVSFRFSMYCYTNGHWNIVQT